MEFTQSWEAAGCLSKEGVATLGCIPVVLQNIINFLVIFAGTVCVLLIMYASFRLITLEGDPEKVATARKTLSYAIAGLLIVLVSFLLLNLISVFTGVKQLAPRP